MPLTGGSRPVDPGCTGPLRLLAARYVLVLSSNTAPGMHRIPALAAAGTDHLFRAVLASACLGIAKPDPAFYAMIPAVAQCQPGEVLHVGNNINTDITGPARCGMLTALIRPSGLAPGEHDQLPPRTLVIRHVRDLPACSAAQTRRTAPKEPIMTEIDFAYFNYKHVLSAYLPRFFPSVGIREGVGSAT